MIVQILYGLLAMHSLQALFFIPALRKAGFTPWWVAPALLPGIGIVLLWVFAFAEWPMETGMGAAPRAPSKGFRIANRIIAIVALVVFALSVPMVAAMAESGDDKVLWQSLGIILGCGSAVVLFRRTEFALLVLFAACAFFFVSCAANFHWRGG